MNHEKIEQVENAELKNIYDEDQNDRREELWKKDEQLMNERDEQRLNRVLELLNENAVKAPADYLHAAMILQHGRSIDHFELAHTLAKRAADEGYGSKEGEVDALWLSAAAKDRLLHRQGKPQLYGTQTVKDSKEGEWYLWPVDPSITDEERANFHVPPLAESQARAEELRNKEQEERKLQH